MNKRDRTKLLKKSRTIVHEIGDFKALRDWSTYLPHVRKLMNAGVENAGTLGVACRDCYKQVPVGQPASAIYWRERSQFCSCNDQFLSLADFPEILGAHGFDPNHETACQESLPV